MSAIADTSWHSYPKIDSLSSYDSVYLFDGPVVVQEKVDGSQFSFGVHDGKLVCRSKGQEIDLDSPGMFSKGVETVKGLGGLVDGWTYRCEYLQKPKHNVIAYDRIPNGHIVLFDIETDHNQFMSDQNRIAEIASNHDIEPVPVFHDGPVLDPENLRTFLEVPSVLGGHNVEGIVIKNYAKRDKEGKLLVRKWVSPEFKEKMTNRAAKPLHFREGIITELVNVYKVEPRWQKAIQHLRERGELKESAADIGPLIKEIQSDLWEEESTRITQALAEWARPEICKGVIDGFALWYKEKLTEGI